MDRLDRRGEVLGAWCQLELKGHNCRAASVVCCDFAERSFPRRTEEDQLEFAFPATLLGCSFRLSIRTNFELAFPTLPAHLRFLNFTPGGWTFLAITPKSFCLFLAGELQVKTISKSHFDGGSRVIEGGGSIYRNPKTCARCFRV